VSGPAPASPTRPRAAAAFVQALVRAGGHRMVVGPLFVLTLVILAGRSRAAPSALRPAGSAGAALESRAPALMASPALGPAQGAADEAVALDNLLTRYDALIRVAEARAFRSGGDDRTITELRGLRARTYAAARRALSDSVVLARNPAPPTSRKDQNLIMK
jgi:hypothetical protein